MACSQDVSVLLREMDTVFEKKGACSERVTTKEADLDGGVRAGIPEEVILH